MTNLKIKALHTSKKKQSIELPCFCKDGYWGLGKVSEYLEYLEYFFQKAVNMSHWFHGTPRQSRNLLVFKRKLFKIYRESWLNGKWIFLYTLLPWCWRVEIIMEQYVMNSRIILVKCSWTKMWLKEQKGKEY